MPATRYRTIWISDVHLGIRESKTEFVCQFLRRYDAQQYYLVGDIVDGWALQRSWHWPASHDVFLDQLLTIAADAPVTYVPGNHDETARRFTGLRIGAIDIRQTAQHVTADGRRFLILHGDAFDGVVRHARWFSQLGGMAYTGLLRLNRYVNTARRWMGRPYWSLAAYLKHKAKHAVQFIADFENAVADRARREDVDGVICGHIHHPEMRTIRDVQYVNSGDWVESCTALVEHHDGRLELVRWTPDRDNDLQSLACEPKHPVSPRIAYPPGDAVPGGDGHPPTVPASRQAGTSSRAM